MKTTTIIRCEYCHSTKPLDAKDDTVPLAQYDFLAEDGHWRYGCTRHWMDHRASKQLGVGHAQHISRGVEPPPRPAGWTAPAVVGPRVLARPPERVAASSGASEGGASTARPPGAPRPPRPKAPGEWFDLPFTGTLKEAKSGVPATAIELCRGADGATIEQIQTAIGPKHDAMKLLRWINENKGHGFVMDKATSAIRCVTT